MSQRHHHSEEAVAQYRTVARRADGPYVVIAAWSSFEKALGCSFGFYAAEKHRYEAAPPAEKAVEYFSVFVQRREPNAGYNAWTTVSQTLIRLDFDCEAKALKHRLPKSGEYCEAVLLARKTKKGGWIAMIPGLNCEGPITNTEDVPAGMLPETTVRLKVGAINKDGDHLQFTWPLVRKP